MKALSLWQPWASLWASGRKIHETRHWALRHHGPLVIHAAKRMETRIWPELRAIIDEQCSRMPLFGFMPRGALLGIVEIVGCVATESIADRIAADEREMGDWSPGRYAFEARNPRLFKRPIPWRGQQGLFDVPDDVVAQALAGGAAPPALTPISAG